VGCHASISATKFPKQGSLLGVRVAVVFHYAKPELGGVIVRDDMEEPYETIVRLDDGRHVRSVECQYAEGEPQGTGPEPGDRLEVAVDGVVQLTTDIMVDIE
jgi:hypothetical protein